jgi:integrase/recombinase XerD
MTALTQHLEDYLAIRRGLGFKLATEHRMLRRFVAFLDDAGEPTITVELGDAPDRSRPRLPGPADARGPRLCALHARDRPGDGGPAACAVADAQAPPDSAHLHRRAGRRDDGLRTDAAAAAAWSDAGDAIGLLACTGIRDSEAFALDRADIDRANRLLRIRDTKYGKSREVLIHDTTLATLDAYLARRDHLRAGGDRTYVFVSCWGARLSHRSVHRSFEQVRQASGVTRSASGRRPRLHDFRHTFAVNTLLGWYRGGENVAAKLPLLSTYLGHVDPAATYWYLSAVPELLALAADRLEQHDREATSDREVALLLREQERVRHRRGRRAGR